MSAIIPQVEKTLEKIKAKMRKNINKKRNNIIYYEYIITEKDLKNLKECLMELYQIGFEQGVYTAK